MAPVKIKVLDEALSEGKPILCRTPRNKKRDVAFLLEGENLKGSDETCDYQATSSSITTTSRFCVAMLDRTEGAEDGYQTLTLRPVVKVYNDWTTSVRGYEQQNHGQGDYRAQYKAMIEDFASAKKRRVVRSREANRLVEDDDKINPGTPEDVNKPSAAELATNQWRKTFLPPWNEKCPEPAKVYDFKDMIGPALWKWIEDLADKGFNVEKCPPSIETLFEERLNEERKPTMLQLSCGVLCAFFTNLFIVLNRKKHIPAVDPSKNNYFGQPTTIADRFLSRFATTTGNGFTMSKANRDSCLVHILLLYLVASHKQAKVDSLRGITTDLQIDGSEAAQLLRQAGCKVVRKNNTYAVSIRTPLEFPQVKRGRLKV